MKERSEHTSVGLADTLLSAGVSGIHPLFDLSMIRRAFARIDDGLVHEPGLRAAHVALRDLARLRGLEARRCHLRALPPATVDLLVYLYFRHLDRQLIAQGPVLH